MAWSLSSRAARSKSSTLSTRMAWHRNPSLARSSVVFACNRAMIEIDNATDPADVAAARELFQEYQEALGVDLSFQGFAQELETLPGEYASPRGRLLLARDEGLVVGCVAMRPLAND